MSPAELDRQYNPRMTVPDHTDFLLRWARRSAEVRARLQCETDLRYGVTPAETIDVFPAAHVGAPLFAFLHGGYWRALDKSDFSFLAPAFVDAGVTLAVVNYGLAPAVGIEEIVRQTLRACAWLWRNEAGLGADPKRLYVGGHSAGGHLTAMMVAAKWSCYARDLPDDLFRGGVCISGLYDLTLLAQAPFLREVLNLDESGARHVSPVSYRPARNVPLLTAVGALESGEFRRQNSLIARTWPHCPVRDVAMPGKHHFSIVEALGDADSALFGETRRFMDGPGLT